MKLKIEMEDNSKAVLNELEKKMPETLNGIGQELYKHIYQFMTEDKVVDTRRLRESISYSTPYNDYNNRTRSNTPTDFIQGVKEKRTVFYGSNVEYASYVETGTTKQRARRYLKTGTFRAVPRIKKVVENILKGEQ